MVGGGIKPTDDIPVTFRYERLIIAGLCLAAAIRVFAFSAAFPFFNNVDEQAHFDMVFEILQRASACRAAGEI